MLKRNLLLVLTLLLLQNSYSKNEEFRMKGTISPDFNGQCVYLQILVNDTSRITLRDTIKNGSFYFHGKAYPDILSNLFFETNSPRNFKFFLVPILESGDIYVDINNSNSLNSRVKGTYFNDEIAHYLDSAQAIFKNKNDTSASLRFKEFRKRFLAKHHDDIAGYQIFSNSPTNYPYFFEYYDLMSERLKQMPRIKYLKSANEISIQSGKLIGQRIPDYEFADIDGKNRKLSDYIGKTTFLFVDIWASWCSPCRADIPNVKKTYEKYKDKGLTVLSISIDDDKNSWKNALQKENMPWEQLVLKNGNEKDTLFKKYHLNGVPSTFLINKDGYIILINFQGDSLEKWLDSRFN